MRRIIHWGLPEDIELYMYLQETGRAGRDGLSSIAGLYNVKNTYLHVEDSMKDYVSNRNLLCRQQLLLRDSMALIAIAIRVQPCDMSVYV